MVNTDRTKNYHVILLGGEGKWGGCVQCIKVWKVVREHEIFVFYNENSIGLTGKQVRRKQCKDAISRKRNKY